MAEQEFKTWRHDIATKIIGILAGGIMVVAGWFFNNTMSQGVESLKSIESKFDVLSKNVTEIKINQGITGGRLIRVEEDIVEIRVSKKDLSKRVVDLEKKTTQHDEQLRHLDKKTRID